MRFVDRAHHRKTGRRYGPRQGIDAAATDPGPGISAFPGRNATRPAADLCPRCPKPPSDAATVTARLGALPALPRDGGLVPGIPPPPHRTRVLQNPSVDFGVQLPIDRRAVHH
jgi:hypothetical protein